MTERIEQIICNQFFQNFGHSCSKTIGMIKKAFVDKSMSKARPQLFLYKYSTRFDIFWTDLVFNQFCLNTDQTQYLMTIDMINIFKPRQNIDTTR